MASRLELQSKLVEFLGNNNVYYQPPESIKIKYPAIIYSKSKPSIKHADDMSYQRLQSYEIIVIDSMPDNPVIEELEKLDYCEWDRHYTADNLHHDVLKLYF